MSAPFSSDLQEPRVPRLFCGIELYRTGQTGMESEKTQTMCTVRKLSSRPIKSGFRARRSAGPALDGCELPEPRDPDRTRAVGRTYRGDQDRPQPTRGYEPGARGGA